MESQLSQSIKSMTDRICGLLARQGAQTGTLFELAWQNHVENGVQDRFVTATNLVKSKMRKRLEADEKNIAERMSKVQIIVDDAPALLSLPARQPSTSTPMSSAVQLRGGFASTGHRVPFAGAIPADAA